jgi:prepilin-type N-terminal cleavage/methylation domain-containing protein
MTTVIEQPHEKELSKMRKGRRGMTLIEVLVATLLFSVCIIIISQLLSQSMRAFKKYRHEANIKRVTDSVLDQMSTEVRTAYKLETCDPGKVVFDRYFSDGNQYKVTYQYNAGNRTVQRDWELVGGAVTANGSDIIGTDIDTFDLSYKPDPDDPTNKILIITKVSSGQEVGILKQYMTVTSSKRRVTKHADNVSITTE